ncbi:MAG TPA: hypothetical protein VMF70_14445 [Gemmatimonadales bacterium]|nr:hypothetical protein [Gemmatimonadales bacterium]
MKLFGVPSLPTGPAAPVVPRLPGLDDQRRLVTRARAEARRWLLRSVLLLVVAALAVRRGWIVFGVVFLALAILGLQLSRSTGRRAGELARRLDGLEGP